MRALFVWLFMNTNEGLISVPVVAIKNTDMLIQNLLELNQNLQNDSIKHQT